MANPSHPSGLPELPCGHGILSGAAVPSHRPLRAVETAAAATSPDLNRPLRSEREALEGRQAAAALDRLLGCRPLLALDTLAVEYQDGTRQEAGKPAGLTGTKTRPTTPPGRLLVALNATGDLWIVAWQNACNGAVKDGLFHRTPGEAFEDLAARCRRAGAHTVRAEVGERLP